MAKEDVLELPAAVPRKRRQLESLLDVHIAKWLADDELQPGDRKRLEAEKARRKALVREHRVGLVVPQEGMTPIQQEVLTDLLLESGATEVHHGGVPSKLHNVAREIGVVHHRDTAYRFDPERDREVVRCSDAVIAAPKELTIQTYATPGVWAIIGYAKNRNIPTKVVLPDGSVTSGGSA
jgi:hypothetical protein